MEYAENILGTIGNTPLVKMNKLVEDLPCLVLAKYETFNPGNSVKDRMALQMIEDAEADGRLKPGGTIIEGTSGNTGMGLALAAIVKGYKCIFVMADKQSKEKVDIMRAVGAEVIVCPTDGTISGVGKYLKEQNPNIKVWGVDTYGSVFKKYHETGIFDEDEIYPYVTEGIGEDILPKNVDFDIIDGFTKVTDKDACVYTQRLAKEEGMFLGNSAGSAIKGVLQLKEHFKPDDVVVVLFHDHGSRYVGKMFNDDWMRKMGYID